MADGDQVPTNESTAVAPLAAGSTTRPAAPTLPEAISNEDGDEWYIEGHVEPALAVLACAWEQAVCIGEGRGDELIAGPEGRCGRPSDEARAHIASLLANVEHGWWIEHPTDEEQMLPAAPTTPGARPYTAVTRG